MLRYGSSNSLTKESDIHKDSLFTREKILAEEFVRASLQETFGIDECPFSGLKRHEILFRKWGVDYALCPQTWSVALANRPPLEIVDQYFKDSPLSNYRATDEYQRSVAEGRISLWEGLIEWVEGRLFRYMGKEAYSFHDVGPKISGWVHKLSKAGFIYELSIDQPLPPVSPIPIESNVDVVGLFDVLQRYHEPVEMLRDSYNKLKPGGLVIGTCRAGSGFDVLTLRGASDSIFPLDHISLPSPLGMDLAIEKAGFDLLEISTPGILDAELVKKMEDVIPKDQYFQRYLASQLDEMSQERLQQFLQANGLSSHLRFVARKPETI